MSQHHAIRLLQVSFPGQASKPNEPIAPHSSFGTVASVTARPCFAKSSSSQTHVLIS